jgi:hypothetical protein
MADTLLRCVLSLLLGVALAAQTGSPPAEDPAPQLDDTTFLTHWDHVVPSEAELAWRRIPWLGTLAEGVVAAQAADRPILLWAMNGHPLACT